MVKLIIEDDEGKTTVVPLIRDEITIGRKEGNTIRLTERNVSRRHAKLLRSNGAIFIEDLDSYNGIKVNGNQVNGRVAVTEGDRIQIGDYVLGLKLEGAVADEDAASSAKTTEIRRVPEDAPTAQLAAGKGADGAPAEDSALSMAEMGRLVCVSANFAGQEWWLDKPVMVVGRTEDNDIVVNHRSISRNHARLTYEGSRYTIRDLQSANGVRINGEEYGKVELRRGDHIDLGHVRLRFVAPGEDFDFERDATVVDISKPARGKGLLWAALSAVGVLVVGLLIWQMMSGPDGDEGTTPVSGTGGSASEVSVATAADAAPTSKLVRTTGAQLLARISQEVSSEQWDEAVKDCAKLEADAVKAAKARCDKAKVEQAAFALYEKFRSATMRNAFKEALQHYNQIPASSAYKSRDLDTVSETKAKYLAWAHKELDELVANRECKAASELASEMSTLVREETQAAEKAKKCAAAAVVALRPPDKPAAKPQPKVRRPVAKPKPKPAPAAAPAKPTAEDQAKAKALIAQAQQAYVGAEYRKAIQIARQVLKLVRNHQMAIQLIGASSCYLKNARDAKWAYQRLPAQRRNLLKTVCERNGLNL